MRISAEMQMHNKYELQLIDSRTNTVKQTCTAHNVVLDNYYSTFTSMSSYSAYMQLNYILLGTGSGTPAVTDTTLFQYLALKAITNGNVQRIGAYENPYQFSVVKSVTFNESEANGNLTEIGLGSGDSSRTIYTHAIFTDSEGHPITITKTNTDRLTVTATVYLSLTFPSGVIPLPVQAWTELEVNKQVSEKYSSLSSQYTPQIINQALGISVSYSKIRFLTGISVDYAASSNRPGLTIGSTVAYTSPIIRYTTNRLLAAEGNLSKTWQVYAIHTPYCIIPLPNHNLFTPVSLTLEQTSDGNTTGFNFGIPELMPSETKVYIDGVLADPNTYTFYGKDFNCRQAWISQHGTYLTKHDGTVYYATSSTSSDPTAVLPIMSTYDHTSANALTLYYDFTEPKTINALKHETNGNCSLYYSNDNVEWTLVTTQAAAVDSVYTFTPITARYWKTYIASFGRNTDIVHCCGAFDYYRPQLQFNTAPPANSVITIETKSEYPLKNSNWIIEQIVFDISKSKTGS